MPKSNEHFVPKCYLKAWTKEGTDQIQVYDKIRDSFRPSGIDKVACEHSFYDTHPIKLLSRDKLIQLKEEGKVVNPDADRQVIERVYSTEVETLYKQYLVSLIKTAQTSTPWEIDNCFFIRSKEKEEIAQLLTIQDMRTRSIRRRIEESSQCMAQALNDMGFPKTESEKYRLSKQEVKDVHLRSLMDEDTLEHVALSFYNLTWILLINKTGVKFYTSDNPIVRIPHISHPFHSGVGLRSKGVEVFFPISPDCGLSMFDGDYFGITRLDCRMILCDESDVRQYNRMQTIYAEETVFSIDGNWDTVKIIKSFEPEALKWPRTTLIWGEKEYTPERE